MMTQPNEPQPNDYYKRWACGNIKLDHNSTASHEETKNPRDNNIEGDREIIFKNRRFSITPNQPQQTLGCIKLAQAEAC